MQVVHQNVISLRLLVYCKQTEASGLNDFFAPVLNVTMNCLPYNPRRDRYFFIVCLSWRAFVCVCFFRLIIYSCDILALFLLAHVLIKS